jgi:hypothetical protein
VLGSVAGVMGAVSSTNEAMTVLVATQALVPGVQIDASDLGTARVPVHAVFDGYLTELDRQRTLYVHAPVEKGGLVPQASVSTTPPSDATVVSLDLVIGQPAWLTAGAVTELWVAPTDAGNAFTEPFVLSPRVSIVAVSIEEGFAANGAASRVDVLVPRRDLPGVIHALANGFFITMTPVQAR